MFYLFLPLHLYLVIILLKSCGSAINFKLWYFVFQNMYRSSIQSGYFLTSWNVRIFSKRPVCAATRLCIFDGYGGLFLWLHLRRFDVFDGSLSSRSSMGWELSWTNLLHSQWKSLWKSQFLWSLYTRCLCLFPVGLFLRPRPSVQTVLIRSGPGSLAILICFTQRFGPHSFGLI